MIFKTDLNTIPIDKLPIVDKEILMDNFDNVVIKKEITKEKIMSFLEITKIKKSCILIIFMWSTHLGPLVKLAFLCTIKKIWTTSFLYHKTF